MARFKTDRLTLRATVRADAPQVYAAMATDFDVVRHTGSWPWPASMDFTKHMCAHGYEPAGGWLIAHRGAKLIGMVGIGLQGDFGYMLPRAAWGQGYATEMSRVLLDQVVKDGVHLPLKACVYTDNPASARVLEKLGFVEGPPCTGRCEARNATFPTRTFTFAPAPASTQA